MQTRISRRKWLGNACSIPVAGAIVRRCLAVPTSSLRESVVDAHVHIWTDDFENYPLADGFTSKDLWFPSFTAEELMRLGAEAGVHRFNLVQMTWYGLDHRYILDVIQHYPGRFVGTGIVPAITDVSLADPGATMVELSKGGIYAFRIRGESTRPQFNDSARWMDHPGFNKMFSAAAEHRLALSFLMTPADLPEVDRMCTKFPDTPVIIDHFAIIGAQSKFVEDEIQQLCKMARHPQVLLKIGAFYGLGNKQPPYLDMLPLIRRVVDAFGPERCMWESDSPLQTKDGHTFAAAVDIIRVHADFLSDSDKQQILVRTAENFFFKR
ncbi:MAG: amidohydrolase [Planctomycetaceae bacterium]|nr:amidohydrolase [Planctomycetaceae bacterium]MBP62128.1 amidohydrolase [Planctomycetaceae bacterium]